MWPWTGSRATPLLSPARGLWHGPALWAGGMSGSKPATLQHCIRSVEAQVGSAVIWSSIQVSKHLMRCSFVLRGGVRVCNQSKLITQSSHKGEILLLWEHHMCTAVCAIILVLHLIQTRSFPLKEQIYNPSIVSRMLKLGMFMQSDSPAGLQFWLWHPGFRRPVILSSFLLDCDIISVKWPKNTLIR